jgi:hypothetical protein
MRLQRLSAAQFELSRFLEARVVSVRSELQEIEETRLQSLAALDRAGSAGLMFYAAAMRRLSELDNARISSEKALSEISQKLARSRYRHDVLRRRAAEMASVESRRVLEKEIMEGPLVLKATDKQNVVK